MLRLQYKTLVVLYVCEARCLVAEEEHEFMFLNGELKRIFGPKNEVTTAGNST